MWLASIISHSRSRSSLTSAKSRSNTPRSRQRKNRLDTLFQWPYSGGKSRHGVPVRSFHKTAFRNNRLSRPRRPLLPFDPGKCGFNRSQTSSVISCRCISDMEISSQIRQTKHHKQKINSGTLFRSRIIPVDQANPSRCSTNDWGFRSWDRKQRDWPSPRARRSRVLHSDARR